MSWILEMRDAMFRKQSKFYLASDCRRGGGQGAHVKNELPALLFGELSLKRGHRFPAFADLVENFAVRNAAHVLGVHQARGRRIVTGGVRPVAFSGLAVALRTFVHIDGAACGQS